MTPAFRSVKADGLAGGVKQLISPPCLPLRVVFVPSGSSEAIHGRLTRSGCPGRQGRAGGGRSLHSNLFGDAVRKGFAGEAVEHVFARDAFPLAFQAIISRLKWPPSPPILCAVI